MSQSNGLAIDAVSWFSVGVTIVAAAGLAVVALRAIRAKVSRAL